MKWNKNRKARFSISWFPLRTAEERRFKKRYSWAKATQKITSGGAWHVWVNFVSRSRFLYFLLFIKLVFRKMWTSITITASNYSNWAHYIREEVNLRLIGLNGKWFKKKSISCCTLGFNFVRGKLPLLWLYLFWN